MQITIFNDLLASSVKNTKTYLLSGNKISFSYGFNFNLTRRQNLYEGEAIFLSSQSGLKVYQNIVISFKIMSKGGLVEVL